MAILKKLCVSAASLAMLLTSTTSLIAEGETSAPTWTDEDGDVITKISNPEQGEREADGLLPLSMLDYDEEEARQTGYAWAMAQRGDYLYIGTWKNTVTSVVGLLLKTLNAGGANISEEVAVDLTDVVSNKEIPHAQEGETGQILKFYIGDEEMADEDRWEIVFDGATDTYYNALTGEENDMAVGEDGSVQNFGFRNVALYNGDLYFSTYTVGDLTQPARIFKMDENDQMTLIYTTWNASAVRANAQLDGKLYYAGTDSTMQTPTDEDGNTAAPLVVIQKGTDDDSWTRVADYRDFGQYPYTSAVTNAIGAPFWEMAEHNGSLYATLPGGEGFIMYEGHPAEAGETANEYGWVWTEVIGKTNGINNPDMAPTAEGYTELGEQGAYGAVAGTYEFNGQLYVFDFDNTVQIVCNALATPFVMLGGDTMAASTYLAPMYHSLQHPQRVWRLNDETGEFEEMTGFTELVEGTTVEYAWKAIEYNGELYVGTCDSAVFYNYITRLTNGNLINMTEEEWQEEIEAIAQLIKDLAPVVQESVSAELEELEEKLQDAYDMLKDLQDMDGELDAEELKKYQEQYEGLAEDAEAALEEIKAKVEEAVENGKADLDVAALNEAADEILDEEEISAVSEEADDETAAVEEAEDETEEVEEAPEEADDYEITIDIEVEIPDEVADKIDEAIDAVNDKIDELYNKIDWEGIKMYIFISDMCKEARESDQEGFDLLKTADGENWTVVTDNGFDDRYNYGCIRFVPTDDGLYIGTANPFYGSRLYLLTNDKKADDEPEVEPEETDEPEVEPAPEETDQPEVTPEDSKETEKTSKKDSATANTGDTFNAGILGGIIAACGALAAAAWFTLRKKK